MIKDGREVGSRVFPWIEGYSCPIENDYWIQHNIFYRAKNKYITAYLCVPDI
jgi:hypothetical protein